jgi:hypothetical protein
MGRRQRISLGSSAFDRDAAGKLIINAGLRLERKSSREGTRTGENRVNDMARTDKFDVAS